MDKLGDLYTTEYDTMLNVVDNGGWDIKSWLDFNAVLCGFHALTGSAFADAKSALSMLTLVSTILTFFAGIPTAWGILRRRGTEGFAALPFLAGFLACNMWLAYGYVRENQLMVAVNVVGALAFGAYIAWFIYWTPDEDRTKFWLEMQTLGVLLKIYAAWLAIEIWGDAKAETSLGYACVICQLLQFAAPLAGLCAVLRQRSTESLPLLLIIAYTLCSLEWGIYGWLEEDMFIIVPNTIGFVFNAFQLGLCLVLPRREGHRSPLQWLLCMKPTPAEAPFLGWEKDGDEDVLIDSSTASKKRLKREFR